MGDSSLEQAKVSNPMMERDLKKGTLSSPVAEGEATVQYSSAVVGLMAVAYMSMG